MTSSNQLINYVRFPSLDNANEDGLLAMGGELNTDTLVSAYSQGIFPWFNRDQPVLWWSPDPRTVLFPNQVRISRSLAKTIRQRRFDVTCDQAFEQVINGCAIRGIDKPLDSEAETWITDQMQIAYLELHQNGYAHSIEVWRDQQLVGGLYGVVLGKLFFGESMFSLQADASKVALVKLCQWLDSQSFSLIDCQIYNDHLNSMGAIEISRAHFIRHLDGIDVNQPTLSFAKGF